MPGTGEEDAKGAQDVRDTVPVSPVPPLGAPGNKKEDEGLAPDTVQIPDPDQSPKVPDHVEQEAEQEQDNEAQEVPEEPRAQDPVSDEEKEAEPEVETKDHGEIAVEPDPKFDLAKLLSGIARVKNSSALAVEDDPVVSKVTVPAKMAKTEGFHEAKLREIQQWERKRVMKSVKDEKYPLIDTTWVFPEKVMASGKTKEKARLVARGFQDLGEGMTDTYSPTCSRNCLRLLLALCATEGWVPAVIDVTTALLQGKPIDRDVYLRPPKEAKEDSDRV